MELIKRPEDKNIELPANSFGGRDKMRVRHNIPKDTEMSVIDYDNLKWLCSLQGLQDRGGNNTTEEAHETFMKNYHKMFIKPLPSLPKVADDAETRCSSAVTTSGYLGVCSKKHFAAEDFPENRSHNIKDHLSNLHKERSAADPQIIKDNRIKDLRKTLRKLPFERSVADNDILYRHLKAFPQLTSQVSKKELKELATMVQMETWKEQDYTVFGNTGFFIVLRGSVVPQSDPWIREKVMGKKEEEEKEEEEPIRSPTPILTRTSKEIPPEVAELTVGDCFGTLNRVEGRKANSRVLTVLTKNTPCEFLKISCYDYKRINEQIKVKEMSEKIDLIQSCATYTTWSRQSLNKLAGLIEWLPFPANTVLMSESFKAPFIGFLKSGECHILRKVDVMHKLPNGKEEQRTKQVVMDRIKPPSSFGEISVLEDQAITCSIITATNVELGIINPNRLEELDETTISLLVQCNQPTFGHLTRDDIHNEYVEQEQNRLWNQLKHGVVIDVINSRGIRPGYGKWSK